MAPQSSRLNRLLTLLDTGSTQATRFAAAQQIGDIAKSHPQDLNSLWDKVSSYLRSKNWDTRVAAARAIGAIAANIKHTPLNELSESLESELVQAGLSDDSKDIRASWSDAHPSTTGGLSFDSFDVSKVLDFGSPLLASGGQEYDVAYDSTKSPEERLAFQKQSLHRRLGLDICEHFMDVSEMIRDEDLLAPKVESNVNGPNNVKYAMRSGRNAQQFVANMVPNYYSKRLSARELNLLKRKAKVNAKDHMKGRSEDDKPVTQPSQIQLTSKATCSDPLGNKKVGDSVDDGEIVEHEASWRWPFSHFVEQLLHDIFDPVWEVRHGTLMALREIMTHQGSCAGVLFPDPNSEQFWLVETDEILESTKRGRDIDLNNVQFDVDTQEPVLKRQKLFEDSVYPVSNLQTDVQYSVGTVTNGFSNIEMNDDSYNTATTMSDNIGSCIKAEPDLCTNGFGSGCKAEDASTPNFFAEDKNMIPNIKFTTELENPKIARMIKLAKHSWIKNWEILQDSAVRLICILSLDRFGDYVSDQVVAPVRETCAQALGAIIKYMHPSLVYATLNVLLQMQHSQEWEIRHGCLLGIKYLVAVRPEMIEKLLIYVLPACKAGLEDPDDDVRAVAAEALIPAVSSIVTLDDSVLHSIVKLLWDILLDLDDLSPSTSSVMNLLSEIYSQPSMVPKMLEKLKLAEKQGFDLNKELQADEHGYEINDLDSPYILSTITPRLWPFMRHTITCVRHSSIRTLERLLEVGYKSSMDSTDNRFWPASVLGDALRIVFQNLLLESNDEIIQSSVRVWRLLLQCPVLDLEGAASSYFSSWMQLASTSYGSPLDATKMFWPVALPRKSRSRAAAKMRAVKHENEYDQLCTLHASGNTVQEKNIDPSIASMQKIIVGVDSERSVTHTRVVSAEALGVFASKLPESSLHILIDPLWNGVISLSGVQRQVASTIIVSWFRELRSKEPHGNYENLLSLLSGIRQWLFELLSCSDPASPTKNSHLPYVELSKTYSKMRNEAKILLQSVESSGLFQTINSNTSLSLDTLSIQDAMSFASNCLLSKDIAIIGENESNAVDYMEGLKNRLLATSGYLKCVQNNLHVTVTASVAAAVVWMSDLPAKLNPIILPLMAAIKREEEEILQHRAAEALAELIFTCIGRKPSPNDKLIKNLCNLTWSDSSVTPQAAIVTSMDVIEDQNLLNIGNTTSSRRAKIKIQSSDEDRSKMDGFISRRGSELALQHLCEKFGSSLFDKLPKLWDCLTEILKPENLTDDQTLIRIADSFKERDPQALINNIQVVGSISPMADKTLQPQLLSLLPCMLSCLRHCHVAVRLAASRSITSMAKSMTYLVMGTIIEIIIKLLADSSSVQARQGAGMLVTLLVQNLGATLVPYAPLLVIPLLKCMGDNDTAVRQSVTHSFAALVPLLPLSRGLPPPTGLSESLSKNTDDAQFLEQLLDNSNIDDYVLPIDLNVKLRRYQQEGINWLSFLRRFKLHGILCDDMGLGKTLQASAIVASDIAEGRACNNVKDSLSLIVCPSTLVGHWAYEIEKFIDKSVITTLQYVGSSQERTSLQGQIEKCNVLITSYDVIRKDIDYLGNIAWNYCILDEGHIIKNPKSKITCAVKQLKAERRLILSGTPIQNNVLELWSLFDFLMPGFLGTERQFHATYGKPLVAAKDSKCSAKDAEAGVLAMEALHKQVMPFLLRRTKDEVLHDLPAKIIQDRYCDLSPLQLKLYEQFSSSDAKKEISTLVNEDDTTNKSAENTSTKATSHIFQAMQYLLKLCSHPLLVVGSNPPDSLKNIISDVIPGCSDIKAELHALYHSPKLVALQEILIECGIGSDASSYDSSISAGQHRVLIFAQHRSLLDVIEKDLFQAHMKSVSYLRLDGGVEQSKRFEIVKTFNSDPTIDVLLLTTNVGGLGLNLTSANTIVFMEHDWNPMKDLQAMDRAHRLGQRKVVNVHRLIMRGTLEEKVMSYQKFKVSVANAVITAENASLKTMNTDQLLDLFTPAPNTKTGLSKGSNDDPDEDSSIGVKGKGASILKGLGELWDQSQYDEEYNLNKFLANFNG